MAGDTEKHDSDRLDRIEELIASIAQTSVPPMPPKFLTIDGAARHVSLSPVSIRRLISSGKLTTHRPVKGRVLVDRIALEQLVANATTRPRSGRGLSARQKKLKKNAGGNRR